MGWALTADMIETCSCNMMCPCWLGVEDSQGMDRGWCAAAMLYRIREGASDGVDLSGRVVACALHFPGPTLGDGNGTGRVYLEDRAPEPQRRELDAIFRGTRGGKVMLTKLVATWRPTAVVPIDVREDGPTVDATVGAVGRVRSTLLVTDRGIARLLNVGLGGADPIDLAPSGSEWRDPDLPLSFSTRSGGRGKVTWKGS